MNKEKIIDLDECVINALKLFMKEELPELKLPDFKRPMVVGSGNAAVTGKIIFESKDAVFADESTFKKKLKNVEVDGGVLVSASGGKHAPIIAKELKKRKVKSVLITNNDKSKAAEHVDKVFVYPKNKEPYTYNTSTYMGMILGKTGKDEEKMLDFIKEKIEPQIPKDLGDYESYVIIVPDRFDAIREMFLTKFDELFGGRVNGRVFTEDQVKHAKTLVPYEKELFISLGYENEIWGENKVNFELFDGVGYGGMMAIGYYIIGKIQKQKPPYFKENLERYTEKISKVFDEEIKPIVE